MIPDAIDTVVAIATPPGRGGVGIVRISGPQVPEFARQITGAVPQPRHAAYCAFRTSDGEIIDRGIALYFPAPHSFTGEDVLELQGHGGPVVLDLLVKRATELGARPARPGEFSERAFLNDKLDLTQAEAVADLIDSASEQAARAALHSLEGEFSAEVHAVSEMVIRLRMYVEAAIDFPEEEVDFLSDDSVSRQLLECLEKLEALRARARQGRLLRDGMNVVIAGRPNAGKSSLLNRLAGSESAIVTAIPGTTRDVLRERILIDGMPLHVVDTAGLREGVDVVEQEGVRRAWDEIERADRLLLVIDDALGLQSEDQEILERVPETLPVTVVRNKIDLSNREPGLGNGEFGPEVRLSAKTARGLEDLRTHLKRSMGYTSADAGGFMARRRHLEALARAHRHLEEGRQQQEQNRAGEMLAEDLRMAQQALGEITGQFTSDDLLGRIFSSFCIGK